MQPHGVLMRVRQSVDAGAANPLPCAYSICFAKRQIHTEQSTVRIEMIGLAAKQPECKCIIPCNWTNRQKPEVDHREEGTAFLG